MADHNLSITQQLVNVGDGDRILLPSKSGLPLTYFGLVTVDTTAQSIQIVPAGTDTINGNQGTVTYKLSGFYVLLITLDSSLGWIINPLAISISDLLSALNLSSPFSATQGGTGLSALPSANYILGVNNAGTAYEGKQLIQGTNITITNGAGSITLSSSASGSSSTDYYQRTVIYQPYGFGSGSWPNNWTGVGTPTPTQTRTSGGSMGGITYGGHLYSEFSAGVNESLDLYGVSQTGVAAGNGIEFWQAIVIPNITNIRVWMAVDGGDTNLNVSDNPGPDYYGLFGFRFSTVAGDTNWMCVTSDGLSGTATITDSGIPVVAGTRYEMMVDFTGADVKFYIDNTLVATNSTNVPESEIILDLHDCITTVSGASRSVYFSQATLKGN